MTTQVTHWLTYGEPIDGEQRVEATHRIIHHTGPNESQDDNVIDGTLSYRGLTIAFGENDDADGVHDDRSLCLSSIDDERRGRIMDEFEER